MDDGGFLLPDYSIEVYGTVNHIENSGWSASIPINDDDSINLKNFHIQRYNHREMKYWVVVFDLFSKFKEKL